MEKNNVSQDTLSKSYLSGELYHSFFALNAALHTLSSLLSSQTKIPLSDLIACEHLRMDGPLTAKEVAARVQMGSGATTAMLDRLEKRGLIRRAPHPSDRRSVMVHYLGQAMPGEAQLLTFLELFAARINTLEPEALSVTTRFLKGVKDDIDRVVQGQAED